MASRSRSKRSTDNLALHTVAVERKRAGGVRGADLEEGPGPVGDAERDFAQEIDGGTAGQTSDGQSLSGTHRERFDASLVRKAFCFSRVRGAVDLLDCRACKVGRRHVAVLAMLC